jgi:hypothetical protein
MLYYHAWMVGVCLLCYCLHVPYRYHRLMILFCTYVQFGINGFLEQQGMLFFKAFNYSLLICQTYFICVLRKQ